MTEHTCERCGSQFTPRPGKRFCSEACRAKAERERYNALGATVDHLVPIAAGGLHTWDNVALAHRRCNLKRGAAGIVQLRLVG